MTRSRGKAVAAALAVAVAAAAIGYHGYRTQKLRELHGAVWSVLQDAAPRLREALALEAGLPQAGRADAADQLARHAEAVERHARQLARVDGTPDRALADAADAYLVTAREILSRQAAAERARRALTASLDALRRHMQSDDRGGAWIEQALAAKERADRDYRDYRMSAEAFATLLDTLEGAQARIAAHVDAALLADPGLIEHARDHARHALAEAAAEMARIKLP